MAIVASLKKSKVCIVSISLAGGGAERSTALLSKMLSNQGYDVHIALVKNYVDFDYAGQLYDIGMRKKPLGPFSTINNLLKFRNYLIDNNFDLIIDNRSRPSTIKESIYSGFLYKGCPVLYAVRSFKLDTYFPKSLTIIKKQARRALGYVAVSKAIAHQLTKKFGINKVHTIYNPINLEVIRKSADEYQVESQFIVAVGRLVDSVKNYSLLIEAYANSNLPAKNVFLKIVGEGPDKAALWQKITHLKMEPFIQLTGFKANPFPYYKNALCSVLTSHYEGFPRTLIESLALGTPVVSVDCESGPKEIVNHGQNGLLVANHNTAAFSEALNNLIFDKDLYDNCKKHASSSVQHLSTDTIAKEWDQLIESLL